MADLSLDALDYAIRWVEYRHRAADIPGLVIGIRSGDDLVVEEAFGLADMATGTPMNTDHRFRVASHSKMYCATAVLQLVEQRRLRLDDRVADHLDVEAENPIGQLTIRHLLSHSSGVFRDGTDIRFWALDKHFPTGLDVVADALSNELIYEPGVRFKYSNVGYAIVGKIVEAVTAASYADHLRTAVLEPLGADSTSPDLTPEAEAHLATGYTHARYGMPRFAVPHVATDGYAPAAGVCTTARELLEFAAAHFHGDERLLSDGSKREAHHGAWKVDGTAARYGLGFEAEKMGDREVVGHGGGFPGFVTFTALDPDDALAVTVLANCVDSGAQALVAGVMAILSASPGPLAKAPKVDPDRARRFTGRFMNEWGTQDIAVIGDRLVGLVPDLPSPLDGFIAYDIVDDETLHIAEHSGLGAPGERVTVAFDERGRASSLTRNHAVSLPPEQYLARTSEKYGPPVGSE